MFSKLIFFICLTFFLYGCGGGDTSTNTQATTCAGDVNETYLRITLPLVTQSDLEAAQ